MPGSLKEVTWPLLRSDFLLHKSKTNNAHFRGCCENYVRYEVYVRYKQHRKQPHCLIGLYSSSVYPSEKLELCQPYRAVLIPLSETMEAEGFSHVECCGRKMWCSCQRWLFWWLSHQVAELIAKFQLIFVPVTSLPAPSSIYLPTGSSGSSLVLWLEESLLGADWGSPHVLVPQCTLRAQRTVVTHLTLRHTPSPLRRHSDVGLGSTHSSYQISPLQLTSLCDFRQVPHTFCHHFPHHL